MTILPSFWKQSGVTIIFNGINRTIISVSFNAYADMLQIGVWHYQIAQMT